ncbi:mitochondrial ornithine carrier Ort1 [Lecanosticta acicola]|uniref:Mitochondrial ornithine carrier Ort1 n=1 Tax=Lecanosticta acicola TaxID=111012 RepID=A0AAI8Z4D5_9PEZI|nr:mitochondrial ornithine carrier Ort1 [Lecanosticta acicola]
MDAKSASHPYVDPTASPAPAVPHPASVAAQASSQGLRALKDITFGSVAGAIGKIIEYPFDTVKVRLQSQPDHLPLQFKGPLDCFRQSIQRDGVRGLYRGVSAPLVGAAAENASLFVAYGLAQDLLKATVVPVKEGEELPLSAKLVAGMASGGITSLVLTPIELVKCRIQVPIQSSVDPSLSTKPLGIFKVITGIYRQEGLIGFWRGQLGTFLRETGGGAAWFGSYEALSLYFLKQARLKDPEANSIPIGQQLTSGAVAGMSYNFIFFPADTIKSKIQTGELTGVKPTFTNVGKELYKAHGLKGLYRGCGITVARSAPSSAVVFTIIEYLRKAFP